MNGGAIAPPTIDMTMSDDPSFVCSPNPRMPSAKIVGKPTDIKKNVANIAYSPALPPPIVTATSTTLMPHRCKHAFRPELADHSAAEQASQHEQTKADGTQPFGRLQPGHAGVIFKYVVDEKAENSGLRRDINKLRQNPQREVGATKHDPIFWKQEERQRRKQRSVGHMLLAEQGLIQVKQSHTIARIGAIKKYRSPQTKANINSDPELIECLTVLDGFEL